MTAISPLRKIPSKIPAPPILTTGAPNRGILPKFNRSAPISAPRVPIEYMKANTLIGNGCKDNTISHTISVRIGGNKAGVTIPSPSTGLATEYMSREFRVSAAKRGRSTLNPEEIIIFMMRYIERVRGITHPPKFTATKVFCSSQSTVGITKSIKKNLTTFAFRIGRQLRM